MKKFARRIREAKEKALAFRHMVESAPTQASQLREAVLMTAGQFQQLKADVQSTLAGVQVDSSERLAQVAREISDCEPVFREAGYEVSGVDIEFSPVQRVIVRLDKAEEVPQPVLQSLLSRNAGRRAVAALLSSMIKAEVLADNVDFENLSYTGLVVHLASVPTIRLCWTAALIEPEEEAKRAAPVLEPLKPAATQPKVVGSFFEPRPIIPEPASSRATVQSFSAPLPSVAVDAPTQGAAMASAEPPALGGTPTGVNPAVASDWRQGALDRFKKMPGVSKYR